MKLKLKNASWSLDCNSAVYILILRGEIVYIGESKNPFSRIGCHVKDMHKRFDSLRIMPCADHRRKYWEAVLIDRYQPIFNSKGKDKETNARHIFELGQIKRRQAKQRVVCVNCKRDRQLSMSNGGNAFFCETGGTTAITTAGSVFVQSIPTPDEEYVKLAKQESKTNPMLKEISPKRSDNDVPAVKVVKDIIYNVTTSVTDPKSLKTLFNREHANERKKP